MYDLFPLSYDLAVDWFHSSLEEYMYGLLSLIARYALLELVTVESRWELGTLAKHDMEGAVTKQRAWSSADTVATV